MGISIIDMAAWFDRTDLFVWLPAVGWTVRFWWPGYFWWSGADM